MIKYRSWNDKTELFVYFTNGNYSNFIPFNWNNAEQLLYEDVDSNETLYENDKVRLTYNIRNLGRIEKKIVIGIVKNDVSGIYISSNNVNYYLSEIMEKWRDFDLKLIGNIHEVSYEV